MGRVRGSRQNVWRGDTLNLRIEGLGDLAGRTNLCFSFKRLSGETDAEAQIQVCETGGLLYIAGGSAATPANGSVTVVDVTNGKIDVVVAAEETAKLENDFLGYMDVQIEIDPLVETLWYANGQVVGDTTRRV